MRYRLFAWISIICCSLTTPTFGSAVARAQGADGKEEPTADGAEEGADPVMMREMSGEQDEEARQHFEAATRLYELGSFQRAAEEFQLAYELSKRPELLYNVYLSYRDGQMLEQSATALRAYLDAMPNAPGRRNLEARLEALERSVAEQKEEEAAANERAEAEVATEQREEKERLPSPAPPEPSSPIVPIVMMSLGGAMLAASAVTGVLALNRESNIEDTCNDSTICPLTYRDLEDDKSGAKTLALVTDVLWIGGAVLAGTGLAWLLFGGDDDEAQATAACVPGSCAASIRGRF